MNAAVYTNALGELLGTAINALSLSGTCDVYRVEIEVTSSPLFADTTPTLDFTGVDAESNPIEYQIQIDDVDTFASPAIDDVSETDSGFANPDNGGDTHPFNSGENIQYTVQGGDALVADTYYWRVRGKDPAGSNTYGGWSSTGSFVVVADSSIAEVSDVALASIGQISGVAIANVGKISGVEN